MNIVEEVCKQLSLPIPDSSQSFKDTMVKYVNDNVLENIVLRIPLSGIIYSDQLRIVMDALTSAGVDVTVSGGCIRGKSGI